MIRPLVLVWALRSIVIACGLLVSASPLRAQEGSPADTQAPAHISLVDGVAVLERDGRTDDSPGSMPLLAGDRVRTRGGRIEILFADGSTLHLDHHSTIDLQSDDLVRLTEGRVRLSIPGPARAISYRIDGPNGWAQITEPGEYRVALLNGPAGLELELAVIRGRALIENEAGQTPLRAGERAFARAGAAPSYAYVANSAALDAFDRWSEARRDERLSASAEYLPDEVRPYAASFERNGYWRDEPTYGRVWYPRVASDWRPYYRGRWVSLRPYGWTWVAHDPWGWPTHHYGRWGYSPAGSWFWIPGRTWGAAWVSWAHAPGYVSWCPLGWNNRPVFQININVGHRGYDPWRAWTVIPVRHFGYGYVHRNVIRAGYLDHGTRAAFVYRDRAPEVRGYAVPRAAAPIRVAGSGPSRRGSSPLYTNVPSDPGPSFARPATEGRRTRTDGVRVEVPNGARPSAGRSIESGSAAQERALPTRPAVRSERVDAEAGRDREGRAIDATSGARPRESRDGDAARSEAARSEPLPNGVRRGEPTRNDAPRSEPSRSTAPRADVPRSDGPRREAPPIDGRRRTDAPVEGPRYGAPRATPRYEPAPGRTRVEAPRDVDAAPDNRRSAVPRGIDRAPSSPSRVEAPPTYRRPAEVQREPMSPPRSDPPASSYEPRRAEPRAEPRGPAGGAREPQVDRRGPDRPPSGSYERRAPASAPPSSAAPRSEPSGDRPAQARPSGPAGPPPGARPRGGGRGGRN